VDPGIQALYGSAMADEAALLAAVQQELSTSRKKGVPKVELDHLTDRILAVGLGGRDNNFLSRLRKRLDAYGIKLPSVTIEYRDLKVTTDALAGSDSIPNMLNTPVNWLKGRLGVKQATVELPVIQGMSGVLTPGRMTLLLGPPGCGKSSFLKVRPG
jgi:hypothetical protein